MNLFRNLSILTLFVSFSFSCDNEKDPVFSAEEAEISTDESFEQAATDELDDLANLVLAAQESATGGRASTTLDHRFDCPETTVTFSNVSADKTSGTATVVFGPAGCTDSRGNVRKGMIVINWTGGKWFREGSIHEIELDDYSINGILIGGTRTLECTNVSGTLASFSISWHIMASHSITWPDGTTALRMVHKIKQWDHSSGEDIVWIKTSDDSEFVAEGTNRHNNPYQVVIVDPLKYSVQCARSAEVFLPISGTKTLTLSDKQKTFTMDFGTGSCDNSFTVSVDGRSREITARRTDG